MAVRQKNSTLRIADNAPASASIRIHTPNRKTRIAPLPQNAVGSPEGQRHHAMGNVTEMFPFTRFAENGHEA
jgi:hypothetical protein